jgi:hypothetical protein
VIVAPGTIAPDGSLTTPRNEVVAFCETAATVQKERKTTSTNAPMRLIKGFLQKENPVP